MLSLQTLSAPYTFTSNQHNKEMNPLFDFHSHQVIHNLYAQAVHVSLLKVEFQLLSNVVCIQECEDPTVTMVSLSRDVFGVDSSPCRHVPLLVLLVMGLIPDVLEHACCSNSITSLHMHNVYLPDYIKQHGITYLPPLNPDTISPFAPYPPQLQPSGSLGVLAVWFCHSLGCCWKLGQLAAMCRMVWVPSGVLHV